MKKRVLAAMMACAMAAGLLSGCSSEPKNPGDSNEPVTTAAAGTSGESQAGEIASAEESGLKIFHDYMTTDVDTINPHIYTMSVSGDVIARTSLQLYRQYPNAEGTSSSRSWQKKSRNRRMRKERYGISRSVKMPSGKMETPLT